MTHPKTTCAAFGCNRWTRRIPGGPSRGAVYLCPAHWPMVPRRLRQLMNKAFRIIERSPAPMEKDITRVHRLWAKCVAAADRNLGI